MIAWILLWLILFALLLCWFKIASAFEYTDAAWDAWLNGRHKSSV